MCEHSVACYDYKVSGEAVYDSYATVDYDDCVVASGYSVYCSYDCYVSVAA